MNSLQQELHKRAVASIGKEPVDWQLRSSPPTFDYSKLDSRYRAAADPNQRVVLYKGGLRELHSRGFPSLALTAGMHEHIEETRDIIESGSHTLIRDLFDAHTSYYSFTALLSATPNPEVAQSFADNHFWHGDKKTIYRIELPANRCVVDCYDTGNCGSGLEVLILGQIEPQAITAVKVLNWPEHSERRYVGTRTIRAAHQKDVAVRSVKDVDNWVAPGSYVRAYADALLREAR